MKRREFVSVAAATVGLARTARSQSARQPDPARLSRIAIMTYNFNAVLKLPGQPDSPNRTIEIFDVPAMLADMYGVHNVEFQHTHVASTGESYLKELRGRLEQAGSRMTNVNLEFGPLTISAAGEVERQQAIDQTKQWVDHAVTLGCPRVMINQGQPTDENKAWAIPALKSMGDYARSKGIKLSVETRLARRPAPVAGAASESSPAASAQGGPGARNAAASSPMTAPPTWVLLAELIKNSGTYANVDIGNVAAQDQGELHAALRTLLPMTVGNIHTRINPLWDLPTALRFITGPLGYTGLFSIEANGHDAVRQIYNIILDTI